LSYKQPHTFWPVTSYICSLPQECFESIEADTIQDSIIKNTDSSFCPSTAQHLTLKPVLCYILRSYSKETIQLQLSKLLTDDNRKLAQQSLRNLWVTHDSIVLLHMKDRQDILRGKQLNDLQVNAIQDLLKREFKQYWWVKQHITAEKVPLQPEDGKSFCKSFILEGHIGPLSKVMEKKMCVFMTHYTLL